jgi:precorrin-6Y C5,15-methyltransferase (decarboxylating)
VLEHLGGPAERVGGPVAAAALGEDRCADLVALVCRPGPDATVQPRVPGLPDDAYESDGQLTRREARALALAALAPGPGQLLWDVGAGSGSIGIEWMRVDARCRAVAVERHGDRAERVRRNAPRPRRLRPGGGRGDAPAALTSLLHISAAQQPFPPPLFHGQVVLANCRESV